MVRTFDRIIVGAGIFGLYSAWLSVQEGLDVVVVDREPGPMRRASYVNQARLHMGYHYPRSLFTARTSAIFFDRFVDDFPDAINQHFDKIYAVATHGSVTSAPRFEEFCTALDVPLAAVDPATHFSPGSVSGAWRTREFSTDNARLRELLRARLGEDVTFEFGSGVVAVDTDGPTISITLADGRSFGTPHLVVAAYAGINALLADAELPTLPLKYELCEMVLVRVGPELANLGITVMDGPFFSLMPFGDTGLHSLSSVAHTPRDASSSMLPTFSCQRHNPACSPQLLDQCSGCLARPASAWPWMEQLAKRFLQPRLTFKYERSIHTVKTVLATSEIDDGRPTLIRHHEVPGGWFSTILSGKLNSIYDLEGEL